LWDRVSRIAITGVIYNFLLGGTLVGIIYLFNEPALNLFLPGDSVALGLAEHLNAIVVWSFLFFGVTFVLFGVVRSTGAVWPPLIILTITMWMVRPPFALGLMPSMGADAIWWSFPLGSLLSMLLAIGYYRWGGWRHAHMLVQQSKPGGLPPVPTQPAPAQMTE
jgi:Na+-driven multidrug efflux pump